MTVTINRDQFEKLSELRSHVTVQFPTWSLMRYLEKDSTLIELIREIADLIGNDIGYHRDGEVQLMLWLLHETEEKPFKFSSGYVVRSSFKDGDGDYLFFSEKKPQGTFFKEDAKVFYTLQEVQEASRKIPFSTYTTVD